MGRIEKEHLKKTAASPSNPIELGNIFEVFSRLEDIAHLLNEFLPQMERLIDLMENTSQVPFAKTTTGDRNLQEKLTELLTIAQETQESSSFVKRIFTQEKPRKTKKQVDKSQAVKEYLHKYNRSMKL